MEAKAVARAVMAHAEDHPDVTLGVAAFSLRQKEAILDELELLRRDSIETESFFNGHPHEPFFVKNLENVQGDERDVIGETRMYHRRCGSLTTCHHKKFGLPFYS